MASFAFTIVITESGRREEARTAGRLVSLDLEDEQMYDLDDDDLPTEEAIYQPEQADWIADADEQRQEWVSSSNEWLWSLEPGERSRLEQQYYG